MRILAGWLIDGTGGPILKNTLIDISGGIIHSIKSGQYSIPDSGDMIDFSQYTILPGLVDAHVHLAMSGDPDQETRKRQREAPFNEVKELISGHLDEQLSHGVVALRDGGDRAGHALRYKKKCLDKESAPLFCGTAGRAWHAEGRYGGLIGRTPFEGMGLAQSIMMDRDGIDHIKIVNSGLNSLTQYGLETPPQFEIRELRDAVIVGEEQGLKTMIHANGKRPVRSALEAGCHSIEHGFFMGEDNLALMAEKGTTWVPTLFTMEAYARISGPGCTEYQVAQKNLRHQIDQVSKARSYGVKIAVGTDSGSPGVRHGKAIREEIRLLVSAGLSLEEGIRCATLNGAALMGIEDRAGSLTPGKQGTFIIIHGGPEERLLDRLGAPLGVWINGSLTRFQPNMGEPIGRDFQI